MVQLLGLCRFSYPSEVLAFSHNHADLDELRAYLYAPTRMNKRLFFFERFVLASVLNQTDPNFTLLVLAGKNMPDEAKARLVALCEQAPQIVPLFLPEGQVHRDVCRDVMVAHRDPDSDIIAEFRLDDDDGVARDFVATTRVLLHRHGSLFHDSGALCIDYCRGHLIAFDESGVRGQGLVERMWTPAQIICRTPDAAQSLLNANHMHLWRHMPTLSWQNRPMFIRGAHSDNDSELLQRPAYKGKWMPLTGDYADRINHRFGVDAATLGADWAAVNTRFI